MREKVPWISFVHPRILSGSIILICIIILSLIRIVSELINCIWNCLRGSVFLGVYSYSQLLQIAYYLLDVIFFYPVRFTSEELRRRQYAACWTMQPCLLYFVHSTEFCFQELHLFHFPKKIFTYHSIVDRPMLHSAAIRLLSILTWLGRR